MAKRKIVVKKGSDVVAAPRTATAAHRLTRTRRLAGATVERGIILNRAQPTKTGIDAALSAVSPEVKVAFEMSHRILTDRCARHVLIGGLAAGVHGYPHATKDVDWLVAKDDVFDGEIVITHKLGIPIFIGGIGIDYLTEVGPANVVALAREVLDQSRDAGDVVVAPPSLLVWMKLYAGRMKDLASVVEMLKAGAIDAGAVESFLGEAGDGTIVKFRRCRALARVEES